jgi:hypothetical protein
MRMNMLALVAREALKPLLFPESLAYKHSLSGEQEIGS